MLPIEFKERLSEISAKYVDYRDKVGTHEDYLEFLKLLDRIERLLHLNDGVNTSHQQEVDAAYDQGYDDGWEERERGCTCE